MSTSVKITVNSTANRERVSDAYDWWGDHGSDMPGSLTGEQWYQRLGGQSPTEIGTSFGLDDVIAELENPTMEHNLLHISNMSESAPQPHTVLTAIVAVVCDRLWERELLARGAN